MYVLTAVRHDDVISDVFAWHTGDPASCIGHIHACLQPSGQRSITKPTIQTINCSGPLWETPSEFHERYCHSRLALFRWLFSVILPHYFFSLLTSAQAHWPIRKGLVPIKLMGPLTSQNCPLTSQFFTQYLRDFLTVRIDPAKYKFLCMPESCSDPSVSTQETAARLKIHGACHLRCAPGYRCNNINCLITGNRNGLILNFDTSVCRPFLNHWGNGSLEITKEQP